MRESNQRYTHIHDRPQSSEKTEKGNTIYQTSLNMSTLLQDPPPLTKPAENKNGALPFNKMFIMLPVMLAARNLKNDDLNTVYMIRVAYVVVQTICLLLAIYAYIIISSMQGSTASSSINRIVYIPAPPQVRCYFVTQTECLFESTDTTFLIWSFFL